MKKECCLCGRDISKYNLDFSRRITCDSCTMGKAIRSPDGEPPTLGAEIATVKALYDQLCKGKGGGVLSVEFFEHLTGEEFKSTRDFHKKMKNYLQGGFFRGEHLKHYRTKMNFSQHRLSLKLECGQRYVSDMENNRKPLNLKTVSLLLRQDLWHWAWPRIQRATPPKPDSKNALQIKKLRYENKPKKRILSVALTVERSLRCWRCGQSKDDHEITIERRSPNRADYVCEDCLRKSMEGRNE